MSPGEHLWSSPGSCRLCSPETIQQSEQINWSTVVVLCCFLKPDSCSDNMFKPTTSARGSKTSFCDIFARKQQIGHSTDCWTLTFFKTPWLTWNQSLWRTSSSSPSTFNLFKKNKTKLNSECITPPQNQNQNQDQILEQQSQRAGQCSSPSCWCWTV